MTTVACRLCRGPVERGAPFCPACGAEHPSARLLHTLRPLLVLAPLLASAGAVNWALDGGGWALPRVELPRLLRSSAAVVTSAGETTQRADEVLAAGARAAKAAGRVGATAGSGAGDAAGRVADAGVAPAQAAGRVVAAGADGASRVASAAVSATSGAGDAAFEASLAALRPAGTGGAAAVSGAQTPDGRSGGGAGNGGSAAARSSPPPRGTWRVVTRGGAVAADVAQGTGVVGGYRVPVRVQLAGRTSANASLWDRGVRLLLIDHEVRCGLGDARATDTLGTVPAHRMVGVREDGTVVEGEPAASAAPSASERARWAGVLCGLLTGGGR